MESVLVKAGFMGYITLRATSGLDASKWKKKRLVVLKAGGGGTGSLCTTAGFAAVLGATGSTAPPKLNSVATSGCAVTRERRLVTFTSAITTT